MKKIIYLMLLILCIISGNTIVNASGDISGTLTNEYGDSYTVKVIEMSDVQIMTNSEEGFSQTVVIDLTPENLIANNSDTRSAWDSTSSVRATLTVFWGFKNSDGITLVKVNSVSGEYTISQSGVQVTSASLTIGTSGWSDTSANGNPPKYYNVSSSFIINPGFAHYVTTSGYSGSNITLGINRGGTNWTLYLQNNY